MRVIGGEARGRTLRAPHGLQTRPTSDLLRGAIFSMLAAMQVQPDSILDLYAGTGALGIEALSRGAAHADFVEARRAACEAIRDNLERAGYGGRGRVVCSAVERALPYLSGPYDLVFIDPPYADRGVFELMARAAARSLISERAVVVYEHSRREEPPATLGGLPLLRTRGHGSSSIALYQLSGLEKAE